MTDTQQDTEKYLEDMHTCMLVLDLLGWSSTPVEDGIRYEHAVGEITETVTIFTNGDATGSRFEDGTLIHEISGSASEVVEEAYGWSL
jgi:hypothetical protein